MFGWSFAARTHAEVVRLCGAMQRHRYWQQTDHRLHWTVDAALASLDPHFRPHVQRFKSLRNQHPDLDVRSRDERLWRPLALAELDRVLGHFWLPNKQAAATTALLNILTRAGFALPQHPPLAGPADDPPHPELLLLDWVFLAVDQLDSERHAGALRAMEDSGDEVDASAPVYIEGPTVSAVELTAAAPAGQLVADPIFWADGPYSYVNYVFRGVRRGAKLAAAPLGYHDI
ncbi:MAG TPA: hypothetical protein ENK23_02895 [Sorangium sp.]|nr:hypothetical protein [Sorangium sp.]